MATLKQTFTLGFAALGMIALATPAQANSFNKFPAQQATQAVSGLQASAYSEVNHRQAQTYTRTSHTTHRRIKRVVKPVPHTRTRGLAYASDAGTQSLNSGFNKMKSSTFSNARPMRVIVDQRAYNAR